MFVDKEKHAEAKNYRYYDFVMGLFITVLLLSNLLSSAKIIDLKTSLGPLDLLFDAGTLVFPISYIFGDILTEVYGYKRARRVIWMGFGASVLMVFFVWFAGVLPGETLWAEDVGQAICDSSPDIDCNITDENWESAIGQAGYDAILGGISGLVVASLAAYWIGEFSNSYVLAKMKVATQGRWLWSRTIGSTLVGQGFDTVVFFILATLLGVFPGDIFLSLVVTNYILKVGIEVLFTPVTIQVVAALKKAENEDYYDHDTQFNPFQIKI